MNDDDLIPSLVQGARHEYNNCCKQISAVDIIDRFAKFEYNSIYDYMYVTITVTTNLQATLMTIAND